MNIEARLNIPRGDEYTQESVKLLGEASSELLGACACSLDAVLTWLERNNTERFKKFEFSWFRSSSASSKVSDASSNEAEKEEKADHGSKKKRMSITDAMDALKDVLERFKAHDRQVYKCWVSSRIRKSNWGGFNSLKQLKQYVGETGQMLEDYPPHRYLFQSFVYHFHLLEFSESLIDLVSTLLDAIRLMLNLSFP